MNPDDDREAVLFREALQRPVGPEREGYLDQACTGNAALRARLAALLKAHESPDPSLDPLAGDFLKELAIPLSERTTMLSAAAAEKPGDRIGHYKLLQQIGEGGCGVVYLAEQEEPVRRRVALKVIRPGMDSKQVLARFEAERQALALMDHPNIAKVLDAGATGTGRPYFVMELVRGIRITDYCDQNNLLTEARLQLFVEICHAIQHAHQKGIIHRDIKPSNILVTLHDGVPVPKVIDFGIAKATGGQVLTDKTLVTAWEQFIGTPTYMSPEQAQMSALDIDTRSDIYGLGVLLYELLTGQTPFDQKELVAAGLDEMRRIIREKEPVRPSTRLSQTRSAQLASSNKSALRIPHSAIDNDLDWIVMKCLEKDRARRYETANGLAQDILHHLGNELVSARPPSRAYRFRKLVGRNKLAFAAAGAVTAALIIGLGLSTWLFFKEQAARGRAVAAEGAQSGLRQQAEANAKMAEANAKRAQDQAQKSEQTALFLKDMLKGVGPSVARGRDTQMLREILDKTIERVGKDLKDSPEVEAELRVTIGEVYHMLDQLPKSEAMFRTAVDINRRLSGNFSTNVADCLDRVGAELTWQGKPREAEPLVLEALMIRTNLLGNEHAKVAASLQSLGDIRIHEDRLPESEALFRRALAIHRKLAGTNSQEVVWCLEHLSSALINQGKAQEAEAPSREALALEEKLSEGRELELELAEAQFFLGQTLMYLGKLEEAETLLRLSLALERKLLGPNNLWLANPLDGLAQVLERNGQLDEAEQLGREVLALYRKRKEAKVFPLLITLCLDNLAHVLIKKGNLTEAEAMLREEISVWDNGEVERSDVIAARFELLGVLRQQAKLDQAESLYHETLTAQNKLLTSRSELDRYLDMNYLVDFDDQLKPSDAESLYREALRLNRQANFISHVDQRPRLAGGLAKTLRKQGKFAEAEPLFREAVTNAAKLWPNDFPNWRWHVYDLMDFLCSQGKSAKACDLINEILTPELAQQSRDKALLEVHANLSGRSGKWKDAATDYTRLIELAPADYWLFHQLASVLVMAGDLEGYRQFCQRILARASSTNSQGDFEQMAKDCLLFPPSATDLPTLAHMADVALRTASINQYLPWSQVLKALAEYRQGHFAGAVEWAQQALQVPGKEVLERDVQAYAVLAMAQYQLKHGDEARASLGKAVGMAETKLPQLDSGDLGPQWWDRPIAEILLREAKALIESELYPNQPEP